MIALLVVAGAVLGAPLRLLAERVAAARRGPGSVLGTLAVNVAGSLVLGLLLGLSSAPAWLVALVGTGFCGTLTTFSTFGLEVVRLAEQRGAARAGGYVVTTLVLGLGAAAGGWLLGQAL